MAAELKPYPAYRDSGVEWLGAVPAHWEVERLKGSLANIVDQGAESAHGGTVVALENVESWTGRVMFADSPSSFDSQLRRFRSGDILFGRLRPYLAKVARVTSDGLCVGEFLVLRPRHRSVSGPYFEQLLRSKPIIDAVTASTYGAKMPRADWSFLGGMPLVRPPLAEQAPIVRFLDHTDRRIERYIRAKERLIVLLEEQKQAILHEAVTGQIDVGTGQPHVAYRDSEVQWLGEVPTHWEVLDLGRLITLTVGFPFKSEGFTRSDKDVRLLRGVNIAAGRTRWGDVVRWPVDDVPLFSEYRLQAGDIVLGMDRPIVGDGIRVAVLVQSDVPSLLLQRVARLRPGRRLLRDFAFHLLSGRSFSDYLAPIFTGISVPHVSPEQIKGFRVALPSVAEQQIIVDYLHSRVGGLRAAMERARDEIVLLREYRARLIADVVTGKLDVRVAAGGLPETDLFASKEDPGLDFSRYARLEAGGDAEDVSEASCSEAVVTER